MNNPLLEEFRNGGWMSWILLLFGILGLMVALVTVLLTATGSQSSRRLGITAVFLGTFIVGLGIAGMANGRRVTDDAVAGGFLRKSDMERVRRAGYAESLSCVRLGLGFSALPLLAGVIAIVAGVARRRGDPEPEPAPWGAPSPSSAPPSPSTPERGGDIAPPTAALGLAGVLLVGAFFALSRPLPGRALDVNDPAWALLGAKDSIDEGDMKAGCDELDRAFAQGAGGAAKSEPSAAALPELADLCSACVDFKLAEAETRDPDDRREALAAISRSRLPLSPAQKRRLSEAIARDTADERAPSGGAPDAGDPRPESSASPAVGEVQGNVAAGSAKVAGGLPQEIIRRIIRQRTSQFRACYEDGLRKRPDLKGRVTVRFVIGSDGSVSSASDGGSDMPDGGVVSCVIKVFSSMRFPQPEHGIVTVTYPLRFTP